MSSAKSDPFGWRDHLSKLKLLGLLYRRPKQFLEKLRQHSRWQQIGIAARLYFHGLPYLFLLTVTGRLLLVWSF